MEFTPVGAYLKVLEEGGKFEANLEIFVLILFLVIEKACECPKSRMKNWFYPTPLTIGFKDYKSMYLRSSQTKFKVFSVARYLRAFYKNRTLLETFEEHKLGISLGNFTKACIMSSS